MLVITRRAANRLARIVHNDVERIILLRQEIGELLDLRRKSQVNGQNRQIGPPLLEVWLRRIPRGAVPGEARGEDHLRAGAEELQSDLETDLDATARDERAASHQIDRLEALAPIQRTH